MAISFLRLNNTNYSPVRMYPLRQVNLPPLPKGEAFCCKKMPFANFTANGDILPKTK